MGTNLRQWQEDDTDKNLRMSTCDVELSKVYRKSMFIVIGIRRKARHSCRHNSARSTSVVARREGNCVDIETDNSAGCLP